MAASNLEQTLNLIQARVSYLYYVELIPILQDYFKD